MRVLAVVQRYNSISEPWMGRMLAGLGSECVGVAGRTLADGRNDELGLPFMRLRSRNVFHRILPKGVRRISPLRPASLLTDFAHKVHADRILCHYGTVADEYQEAWARLDLPLFVYFHGYDLMFDMREQDGKGAPIHGPGYRKSILKISERATFISNSNFSRNRLIEAGVAPDRIQVNYLGVVVSPLVQEPKEGRPKILYVGRFVDCKGPDLTIQAFNELRSQQVDAELVLVGDGPLRAKCLELAAESPFAADISLPGVEDHVQVQQRLNEASVFTMHSIKGPRSHQEEAFGVAFLDAMAVGLPVVTGRSGGVPEIVQDGTTGFLVEPGDVKAHAQRLAELITNPLLAADMGKNGRDLISSKFSQRQSDEGLHRILTAM